MDADTAVGARFDFTSTSSGYAVIQELPLPLHTTLRKCTTNLGGLSLTRAQKREEGERSSRERETWNEGSNETEKGRERERERDERRTRTRTEREGPELSRIPTVGFGP